MGISKKEFREEVVRISGEALERVNGFLEEYGLSCEIDWDYDDWDDRVDGDAIGVYESCSVFDGVILVGFNIDNLYKVWKEECSDYPWTDPWKILDEAIQTNVYHEVGHGLCEKISDYLSEVDGMEDVYDENSELFDGVLNNEEEAVEEFAWDFYDNDISENRLLMALKTVYNVGDGENGELSERVGVCNIYNKDYLCEKQNSMKKRIRLTESDMKKLVKKLVKEGLTDADKDRMYKQESTISTDNPLHPDYWYYKQEIGPMRDEDYMDFDETEEEMENPLKSPISTDNPLHPDHWYYKQEIDPMSDEDYMDFDETDVDDTCPTEEEMENLLKTNESKLKRIVKESVKRVFYESFYKPVRLTNIEDLCNTVGCTLSKAEEAQSKIESILNYLEEWDIITNYNADKLDWIFSDEQAY